MGARICVVILFFWALLTIVTPILVHLSTNPNLMECYDEEELVDYQSSIGLRFWWRRKCRYTEGPLEPISTPTPAPTSTPYDNRRPQYYMMEIKCKNSSRKVLVTVQQQ
ncbi:hypothetical protein HanPI659440_Chr02g0044771 [Helianthus annuus]|uniref:Uncharacterized protein n=1 Tax=Helianthus annuus TaxID=4232 RepID=A0A251VFM2_HELAN|nr:uncharacterized protein LOC110915935 [Helianthus annuus]KAF5817944.1 hypothetical protein HanXRQr2_Chr02g0058941 [Helianthus annuus]KAJ0604332.1 hypothetical protein HanHA300_Chr02g0048541 [Helianthus annuus]KAJ0618362.1 hypothetical protein HanHA89_Chr02g0052321 [Helianthus annuus]KAJ0776813.1 hypothetical protein HanLR1_Chr02g0049941 [Helianthus annuus]KAJ0805013.1 hypothetical protein HanPI659440_Chr02g0044771 [Helianthus annuus]